MKRPSKTRTPDPPKPAPAPATVPTARGPAGRPGAETAAAWRGGPSALDRAFAHPWAYPSAILLLGLVAFGGALGNGFTTWDDNVYVTENRQIGDLSLGAIFRIFTTFENCNYHPLTTLSWRLEHALVGMRPKLYHLTSLALHLGAGVLAYRLARRWLREDLAAFLAALLFLLHPLRVESVAWVSERKDVLCAFFYLAAVLAYPGADAPRRGPRYLASLGLFLLALLSKAMAITLPAVLVLVLLHERRATWPELRRLAPFFVLSAAFSVLGILAQAADDALVGLHGRSVAAHLLALPAAVAFYAGKLVLPILLSPRYLVRPVESLFEPRVLAGILLLAGAAWIAWADRRRRGTAYLGLAWFAVTWAPVSGIVASSTLVADRYVYLPSLGLFVALLGWIRPAAPALAPARASLRRVGTALVAAFLGWCLVLTPAKASAWRNTYALWRDALAENPGNSFAHNQLSTEYFCDGRYAESVAEAQECIRFGLRDARFLYNLSIAYRGLGDGKRELALARETVRREPDFLPGWLIVIRHDVREGRLAEATETIDWLEKRFPGHATLLFARAQVHRARGDLRGALALVLHSLNADPADPEVIIAGAALTAELGDVRRALEVVHGAFEMQRWQVDPAMRERLAELIEVLEKRGGEALLEEARRLRGVAGLPAREGP